MPPGTRFRALVAVACVASLTVDAVPGDANFESDLAECRSLARQDKWDSAQKAYTSLFARYRDDPRIVTLLPAIEDDLRICQFRKGRPRPKGTELYGPEVVKLSDSGDIELIYPSFPSGKRWIGDADEKHKLLDFRFEREVTVEVPAEGYSKSNGTVEVSALLCWNPETRGGYFVAHGIRAPEVNAWFNDSDLHCVVYELGGAKPVLLASNYSDPAKGAAGERSTRFIRISRTASAIRLDLNDRLGVRADDATFSGGYLALAASGSKSTTSVRVRGKLDPVWHKQHVAAFEDEAFRLWVKSGYDRAAALPEWLRSAGTKASADPDVPSDTPEDSAERLRAFAGKVLRGDEEIGPGEVVAPIGLAERAALFAAGLAALAKGGAADAKASFVRLVELEPLFAWGHVALARAQFDLRDLDGARASLAAARGIDPGIAAIYENLALIAVLDGNLAAARAALDDAVKAGAVDESVRRMTRLVSRATEGPRWPKSYRSKSPHFDVRSDHSQQMCSDVAQRLEGCLKEYAALFRPVEGGKGGARVDVFSSRDSYLSFANEVGMDLSSTLGAYTPALRELVVWYPEDRVEFWQTVRHEAFHQFVHNFTEDLPLWFNEGYAEYFGKGPFETDGAAPGGDRSAIVAFLREKQPEMTPLADLFRASRREFMAKASLHYAQSWAVVSFLRSTKIPDMKPLLGRYFDALVGGAAPDEAYDRVLAPLVPRIQYAFDAYLVQQSSAR